MSSAPTTERRLSGGGWAALAFGLAALLMLVYWAPGFPLDDAWIHQTYARNLVQRGEWAFVPGQPSAASTSPLWTLLLAAGHALRVPPFAWVRVLGALTIGGLVLAGVGLARRLDGHAPRTAWLYVAAMLLLTWQLLWAAASGMETALMAAWTLWLPLLAWSTADAARASARAGVLGVAFGALSGAAFLTRPEAVLLAGLCGLALTLTWRGARTAWLAWVVGAAVGFALASAPYVWWNYRLTGDLLPATSAAKQAEYAPLLALPFVQRAARVLAPLGVGGQALLLPGLMAFGWRLPRLGRAAVWGALCLIWPLALVLLYAWRLPVDYQYGRYVLPALPLLVVAGGVGTVWLLTAARRHRLARVLTRTLGAAALLVFVVFAGVGRGLYARDAAIINEEMVAAAHWLAGNVPPDALLAVHDIGAVGYFAPRPVLDLAGLVSPEVVPLFGDEAALWALLEARGTQYLMAFPDQIPGQDADDPRLCRVVYRSVGGTSPGIGGPSMTLYALAWGDNCAIREP